MDPHDLPLPPGSKGLPLVGEALSFAKDAYGFVSGRANEHGTVVRSRLLDKDFAVLSGPSTAAAFLDEENIQRAGGLPEHAAGLFGDGVVNQIDGEAHRTRKRHLMRAVDHHALAHYLPALRQALRGRMARWHAQRDVRLQDETILATLELTLGNFAGVAEPDERLSGYADGYADFAKALVGLPLALPGTPLKRARTFTLAMRTRFAEIAAARRLTGTDDGISRLVASEVDGDRLRDEDIGKEVQHLIFAASGLWSWFCLGTQWLAEDPALRARLVAAIADLPSDPSGRQYSEVADLQSFIWELKRLGLVIPITALGVARRDFVVDGHRIPKGWLVTWSTHASHVVARTSTYDNPGRVDLDRYAAPRSEDSQPHSFAPQGPGQPLSSHRCAGVEYSTLVMQVFFVELLRGPAFSLPQQDLSLDHSSLPAKWKGGLQVRFGA
jgi:retinoid hydroxylase